MKDKLLCQKHDKGFASFPTLIGVCSLFFMTSIPLHADTYGLWSNRSTSAPVPGNALFFNVDTPDSTDPPTRLFYSINNEVPWNGISMELIGEPDYETTWEAAVVFPATEQLSKELSYYLQMEFPDSLVLTESPINASNQFPPSEAFLVSGGNEPIGDAENNPDDWMDLAGFFCGYSEDRFYVKLENNSGQWPTSGGFFGPWYIHAAGFSNVTADLQADTVLYALVYANIAFAGISPGLFRVRSGDFERPERIGDIQYAVAGHSLYMSCNRNDILNDPGFGEWPNGFSVLGFGAMTHTTRGYGTTAKNDSTQACGFVPHYSILFDSTNTVPVLTNPGVLDSGGYRFQVTYTDADNHLPVRKLLLLDLGAHEMTSPDHQYDDGSRFGVIIDSLSPGTHYYSFRFSDEIQHVSTPYDTFVICMKGDVTGDGSINVLDALRAVNIILDSGDPASAYELCAADMDGNDEINVLDVVGIVNSILGALFRSKVSPRSDSGLNR